MYLYNMVNTDSYMLNRSKLIHSEGYGGDIPTELFKNHTRKNHFQLTLSNKCRQCPKTHYYVQACNLAENKT